VRRAPLLLVLAVVAAVLAPAPPAAASSSAPCPPSPFTQELADALAARFPGARFSASVADLRDGCTYELRPGLRMTTASVFKVEVLAGVLLRAQGQGRGLNAWEAERVRPMIARSANPPTNDLFSSLGGVSGINRLHRVFGLAETSTPSGTWGLTSTTARDQVKLLRQVLLGGRPLGEAGRQRALAELAGVVPEQRWGITEGVPRGRVVALKNGFAGSRAHGWRLNSVGMVAGHWLVATLTDGWPSEGRGIDGNRFLNRAITTRLARLPIEGHPSAEAWVVAAYTEHHHRRATLEERTRWSAELHQGADPRDVDGQIRDGR
jgi:beta-lactamase class A